MNNEYAHNHDPLQPHSHDPNPEPPSDDATIVLSRGDGTTTLITVAELARLPQVTLDNCYIVSTGHGTSGPFTFAGPALATVIAAYAREEDETWSQAEVISGDGFGTRVWATELSVPDVAPTIILACTRDGVPLTRQQGLVRLIVPSERDDALRQVKWVEEIRMR